MCGLHIVVHADELEELINYYQVTRESGTSLSVLSGSGCLSLGFNLCTPLSLLLPLRTVATLRN